jgi:hypothetical protein
MHFTGARVGCGRSSALSQPIKDVAQSVSGQKAQKSWDSPLSQGPKRVRRCSPSRRRQDWPADADMWRSDISGPREKARLQTELRAGRYRASPAAIRGCLAAAGFRRLPSLTCIKARIAEKHSTGRRGESRAVASCSTAIGATNLSLPGFESQRPARAGCGTTKKGQAVVTSPSFPLLMAASWVAAML